MLTGPRKHLRLARTCLQEPPKCSTCGEAGSTPWGRMSPGEQKCWVIFPAERRLECAKCLVEKTAAQRRTKVVRWSPTQGGAPVAGGDCRHSAGQAKRALGLCSACVHPSAFSITTAAAAAARCRRSVRA